MIEITDVFKKSDIMSRTYEILGSVIKPLSIFKEDQKSFLLKMPEETDYNLLKTKLIEYANNPQKNVKFFADNKVIILEYENEEKLKFEI